MTSDKSKLILAIASAISTVTAAAQVAQPMHPEKPTYEYEKCYGVARAGQNDCFTASNSCGGTVFEEGRKDAWIYVPQGTCQKIIDGSLEPGEA
jgi:uncharacterized membrane protein